MQNELAKAQALGLSLGLAVRFQGNTTKGDQIAAMLDSEVFYTRPTERDRVSSDSSNGSDAGPETG